jgi:solute carrier family 35, member F5
MSICGFAIGVLLSELSFIGVLLVSLSDKPSSNHDDTSAPVPMPLLPTLSRYANPLLGDVLALASAMFYALYVILLKVSLVLG